MDIKPAFEAPFEVPQKKEKIQPPKREKLLRIAQVRPVINGGIRRA